MRRARVVTALLAATIALLNVGQATAIDRVTKYYAIRLLPADQASPHLFLTQTPNGLRLQKYRSGDPGQMWTITQPDYPAAAAVVGSGPLDFLGSMFEACFGNSNNDVAASCDFRGNAGIEIRLVNRETGHCLTVGATRAVGSECSNTGNNPTWQRIRSDFDFDENAPALTLANKNRRCLGADPGDTLGVSVRMLADECGGRNTKFTPQPIAEVPCKVDWEWELCF